MFWLLFCVAFMSRRFISDPAGLYGGQVAGRWKIAEMWNLKVQNETFQFCHVLKCIKVDRVPSNLPKPLFQSQSWSRNVGLSKLMIELSAKVNLGGLSFQSLTNILITVKKLILLIISFMPKKEKKAFSEDVFRVSFEGDLSRAIVFGS